MSAPDAENLPLPRRGPLQKLLYVLSGSLLLAILTVVVYATIARYFFNAPPIWGEEVPRVLFVWMTYLGAGLAIVAGLNVRVTYFVDMLPAELRRCIEIVAHAAVLVLLVVLAWHSRPVIELHMGGSLQATGWNASLMSWPLPIGCALMILYQSRLLWRALNRRPKPWEE